MTSGGPDGYRWGDLAAEVGDLAELVRARFESHPHHVLATLHSDGRPRVNGTNVLFGDGRMWIGAMPGTRKAADLRRDPRCALHSAPLDEHLERETGDARIEAVALPLDAATARHLLDLAYGAGDGPQEGDFFELRVTAMSLVTVDGDTLRIRSWSLDEGSRHTLRK